MVEPRRPDPTAQLRQLARAPAPAPDPAFTERVAGRLAAVADTFPADPADRGPVADPALARRPWVRSPFAWVLAALALLAVLTTPLLQPHGVRLDTAEAASVTLPDGTVIPAEAGLEIPHGAIIEVDEDGAVMVGSLLLQEGDRAEIVDGQVVLLPGEPDPPSDLDDIPVLPTRQPVREPTRPPPGRPTTRPTDAARPDIDAAATDKPATSRPVPADTVHDARPTDDARPAGTRPPTTTRPPAGDAADTPAEESRPSEEARPPEEARPSEEARPTEATPTEDARPTQDTPTEDSQPTEDTPTERPAERPTADDSPTATPTTPDSPTPASRDRRADPTPAHARGRGG